MKNCSPDKSILSGLNINSIRNKSDSVKNTISRNIDILLISETKVDNSFPLAQLKTDGFSVPFRLDINTVHIL